MSNSKSCWLAAAFLHPLIFATAVLDVSAGPSDKWTLWYDAPAKHWLDAMPLGNGNIGAMVFGGVQREQVALNEVTMWSGEEYKGVTNQGGRELMEAIQAAYLRGDDDAALKLVAGFAQTPEARKRIGTHLPVGDLFLNFSLPSTNVTKYRRELDLERSVARVSFLADGAGFAREVFVSNPDEVIVVRLTSDQKHALNFSLSAVQWQPKKPIGKPLIEARNDELILTGQALEDRHSAGTFGVHCEVRAKVLVENGTVHAEKQNLVIQEADAVTVLISIATDFRGLDFQSVGKKRVAAAAAKTYAQLLKAHLADVQPRFNRVDLTLGNSKTEEVTSLSTDARLKVFNQGGDDPALLAQFFQFGRYLTLAGSRENSRLPLPLQGLWTDGKAANMGWSDDYHLDVNTEQNYWVAEVGNLPESHWPLMEYINQLHIVGHQSASKTYGARGWCAHITANAWAAAPFNHGGAPTVGAWQATHLWEHYAFTGDKQFLAQTAYPILKECAEFFLDTMITNPATGWLVTCPAYSPEDHYQDPATGTNRYLTLGNTGDTEIIHELFRECIAASEGLGLDADFRALLERKQAQLPPLESLIHQDGRLMEWLDPRYDGEYARNHRHTCHLLGLYPFEQISPATTPAVVAAARATLADKLSRPKFEDTEWGRGNFVNFFARLHDGDAALGQLRALFKHWVPGGSLLTVSWGNIFCLDGNTAGAAGIAEMLLQSQSGEIELLPALPKAWPDGHISGLRARGGFEVSVCWQNGKLIQAKITSLLGNSLRVRLGSRIEAFKLARGKTLALNGQLKSIRE